MTPLDTAARALALSQCGEACFQGLEPEAQEALRENVRAVLQAIREPSDGKLKAGFEDYPTIWTAAITAPDQIGVWQAMIDAILSE